MKHTLALITTLLASSWIHAAPEGAVDRSVQGAATPAVSVPLERILTVDGSHLIVPVSNREKDPSGMVLLGIYDGEKLVRDFTVGLPQGEEAFWLAA